MLPLTYLVHLTQIAFTGNTMSKCVPGIAQLFQLIGMRSQYFNGIDITRLHICADVIKISMPSSHLSSSQLSHLHYFSLTHSLASFSLVSFSSPPSHFSFLFFSPFFSYHGWAETPPSRCCWFSQGHCWPWGTQKHSDQCSDMITPEVCLSSDGPR